MKYGKTEPLGYRYKPNKEGHNKKMVEVKKSGKKKIFIDAKYNIDKRGNRKLPFSKSIDYSKSILFLGGSLTFGEGLNDNETLPYYISRSLKVDTLFKLFFFEFMKKFIKTLEGNLSLAYLLHQESYYLI